MILIDTSVWIGFFKGTPKSSTLADLLEARQVVVHPWIIGELMVGNLGSRRAETLQFLEFLPFLKAYPTSELRGFIDQRKLFGQGLSLVDVQILYASVLEGAALWTHDTALLRATQKYGKVYEP